MAHLIDTFFVMLPMSVATSIALLRHVREIIALGVVSLIAAIAYQLHLARAGHSVGKRLMRIRVVRDDGSQASVLRIVARNTFSLVACVIPPLFVVVLWDAVTLIGGEQRCVHDLMTRTKVVKVPTEDRAARGISG